MKNDYVVRARKFLETFITYIPNDGRKDLFCVERSLRQYQNDHTSRKVEFFHGAVRFVLATSDYVIKWDYDANSAREYGGCVKESKIWNKVKNSSYAYLFTPITRIHVGGHYWYVMPRIKGEKPPYVARHYLNDFELQFLERNDICDLHKGNFKLVKKKVKIFDYACGW